MGLLEKLLWKFGGRRMRQRMLDKSLAPWRIGEADNKETNCRIIHRFRIEKPSLPRGRPFATAIEIEWTEKYDGSTPPDAYWNRTKEFEDALDGLSGDNGYSELVSVLTGFGTRT